MGIITVLSVACPEPPRVTINSKSNDPKIPYDSGTQDPIIPPSLNDISLPPNPFINSATMVVVRPTVQQQKDKKSAESSALSEISSVSTLLLTISAVVMWETFSDVGTFYSDDETTEIVKLSSPSLLQPPREQKRRLRLRMSFSQKSGVSMHVCEACGQVFLKEKDTRIVQKLDETVSKKLVHIHLHNNVSFINDHL